VLTAVTRTCVDGPSPVSKRTFVMIRHDVLRAKLLVRTLPCCSAKITWCGFYGLLHGNIIQIFQFLNYFKYKLLYHALDLGAQRRHMRTARPICRLHPLGGVFAGRSAALVPLQWSRPRGKYIGVQERVLSTLIGANQSLRMKSIRKRSERKSPEQQAQR